MDCCEDEHPDISIKVEPILCCCESNTEQTPFLRHCLDDTEEQHNQHSCGDHHHCSDGHQLSSDEQHHHSTDAQYQHSTEEQHHHPSEEECCSTATSYPCQGELSAVWVQGSPQPIEDETNSIDKNDQDASNQANFHGSRPETEVIYCNGYQATDVDSNGHDLANANDNRHEISNIDQDGQDATINKNIKRHKITSNEHEMTNCCINLLENVPDDGNELDATCTVNSCLHETANIDSKTDLHDILLWSNEKDLSSHDLETDRKKCSRCHIKSASGDPHPNCLGHSRCFKRYIWDPRYCDYCNELKRRAERGEETALRVYKKRIKNMGRLAGKHRTSNHWIHPMASHYRINQHGFTTGAGTGNSGSKYQQNVSNEKQLENLVFIKKEMDFRGFEVEEISSLIPEVPLSTSGEPPSSSSEGPPFSTSQLADLPSVDAEPPSTETKIVDTSRVAPTSHDRTPSSDSSSTTSRKCSQCAAYVTLGDTHPNCLTHSSCFKNFTWDPRSCSFCNELREGAVTGDVEAWTLYKRRYQNMMKRARVHGNLQVWINPLAVDYILPNSRRWRGFNSSPRASPEGGKALTTAHDESTSAEYMPKDIALDQRHNKIFKDTIFAERICSVCPSLVVAGDKHPNCLRHSCCFKTSVWDPQNCQYCIDLKQRTDKGLGNALDLFRLRLKAMNILALRVNKKLTSTVPQWLPAAGIENLPKVPEGSNGRKFCARCNVQLIAGDPHLHCLRHSNCFKAYVWDPQHCQQCQDLKQGSDQGQEDAVLLFNTRLKFMYESARNGHKKFVCTLPDWIPVVRFDEHVKKSVKKRHKACSQCHVSISIKDEHPKCIRHSDCFRNYNWEPSSCEHCIALKQRVEKGNAVAAELFAGRVQRMRSSALEHGVRFSDAATNWLTMENVADKGEHEEWR